METDRAVLEALRDLLNEMRTAYSETKIETGFMPTLYCERLANIKEELRKAIDTVVLGRQLFERIEEMEKLIEVGADLGEVIETTADIIDKVDERRLLIEECLNYADLNMPEKERTVTARNLLNLITDLLRGKVDMNFCVSAITNAVDAFVKVSRDIEIMAGSEIFNVPYKTVELIPLYDEVVELLRQLKAELMQLDESDILPEDMYPVMDIIFQINSVLQRATEVSPEHLRDGIPTELKPPERDRIPEPNVSPYLLRLEEILNDSAELEVQELSEKMRLGLSIIKDRYSAIREVASYLLSEPEFKLESVKSVLQEIKVLLEKDVELIDRILLDLDNFQVEPQSLREVIDKLKATDRRYSKLTAELGELLKIDYKYCPRCGAKNSIEATKCEKCGFIFKLEPESLIDLKVEPEYTQAQTASSKYQTLFGRVITDRLVSILQLVEAMIREDISLDNYIEGLQRHVNEITEYFNRYRDYMRAKASQINSGMQQIKREAPELYQELMDTWIEVNTTFEDSVSSYLDALEKLKDMTPENDLETIKQVLEDIFNVTNTLHDLLITIEESERLYKQRMQEVATDSENSENIEG